MKELLEEALKALNQIHRTRLNSGKYKDTYELAAAIDKFFKDEKVEDPFSSSMFTQLKIFNEKENK